MWYWCKNRQINQWKRIEGPEIASRTFGQLIFNKGAMVVQWTTTQTSKKMVQLQLNIHMGKNEPEPLSYTIYKN